MKNNTKLIMETWRRFLKEGPSDDIESFYGDDYDPSQEEDENSIDEPLPGEAPFDSNMPVSDDDIGDPAMIGRDSSAPMLGAPGDDDMMYDSYDEEEEDYYASRGGRPEPGEDTSDETMLPSFDEDDTDY